jgi:hypothetical protein
MAAIASSLAFALLHAYQGPVGILRSGMLGFVFAAAFILTGSIWPQVVVHAGVDLISGLWLGPRSCRLCAREQRGQEADRFSVARSDEQHAAESGTGALNVTGLLQDLARGEEALGDLVRQSEPLGDFTAPDP